MERKHSLLANRVNNKPVSHLPVSQRTAIEAVKEIKKFLGDLQLNRSEAIDVIRCTDEPVSQDGRNEIAVEASSMMNRVKNEVEIQELQETDHKRYVQSKLRNYPIEVYLEEELQSIFKVDGVFKKSDVQSKSRVFRVNRLPQFICEHVNVSMRTGGFIFYVASEVNVSMRTGGFIFYVASEGDAYTNIKSKPLNLLLGAERFVLICLDVERWMRAVFLKLNLKQPMELYINCYQPGSSFKRLSTCYYCCTGHSINFSPQLAIVPTSDA